jgi:hypothetical protein
MKKVYTKLLYSGAQNLMQVANDLSIPSLLSFSWDLVELIPDDDGTSELSRVSSVDNFPFS